MKRQSFTQGVLTEEWDSIAGTYTQWNPQGVQTSQRALTAQESSQLAADQASATVQTNGDSVRQKAVQALATNATFMGLASPTNAQVVTEVKALARQVNGLIRLMLNQLQDISDT